MLDLSWARMLPHPGPNSYWRPSLAGPDPLTSLLPAQLYKLNHQSDERDDKRRNADDQNHSCLHIH